MKKLLITGAFKYTQEQYNELVDLGYEIVFVQNENDELPTEAYNVDTIICNGLFLHHDIDKFPNLTTIQIVSAGLDRLPLGRIKELGIKVFNARGVYSIPMAEYALSGVLDIFKKSRFFYENQKKGTWLKNREITELFGKNVLIVGAGSVGTECAKRFSAFGTTVRGVDLFPRQDDFYSEIVHLDCLKDELKNADIVVLTLPLTDETRHLFNKDMFDAIKTGAMLVNIARGAVVETDALIEALNSGKLSAAVLDVFEEEPLSKDCPLWQMPNVIITPHNSFMGDGNNERLFGVIKNNLS